MKHIVRGYTLVELLIVITLLGVVALVATPEISSTQAIQLEVAAQELVDAIEYARSESIRTRREHGVEIDDTDHRIRVFRADTSATPPTALFDVYHPLSKKLYDIRLDDNSFARLHAMAISASSNGSCNDTSRIIFDSTGSAFCGDPFTSLYLGYKLRLTVNNISISVSLAGTTGRVWLQ